MILVSLIVYNFHLDGLQYTFLNEPFLLIDLVRSQNTISQILFPRDPL